MFDKILVANRGEIAVRIMRTCTELDVATVAVYSDVDSRARHRRSATEAVHLSGVAPADTYLNAGAVIDAARSTGAQAIHPGYGFLSENADFAEAVAEAGLVWIGPPPDATRSIGDKVKARNIAVATGVPVVPGLLEPVAGAEPVRAFGDEHGYPVAIKAAGGGGGRGLKVAHSADEVDEALDSARREARAYFSSEDVYVERYLDAPKHLEVQILSPNPDEALWLGVRDCSLQRRHQKLIEETPPGRWAERSSEMGEAAVALAKACGYVNAGTVEMLVDDEGRYYFLEVNARLQVEHTVTEEVLGIDLVACQLRIEAGDELGFSQADLQPQGHSIECRINAEDPARGFIPSPGVLDTFTPPSGPGVRTDAGYEMGDEVPEAYDSLIAKVIVRGTTREDARRRMIRALQEMRVEGVATTIPAHLALLEEASFTAGTHTTRTVEDSGVLDALVASSEESDDADVLLVGGRPVKLWHPSMSGSAAHAVHGAAHTAGEVIAPMQGTILKVLVSPNQDVEAGDELMVLEAMKMETTIAAPRAGRVATIGAEAGDTVQAGQLLISLE
ncbi:MAG: carbamoyl phosphate synthase [Actinomycetota bacterium]|nr:carbamoyl phosphate synthase [Actinomycetota bacterium]